MPKRKVSNLLALAVLSYLMREPMHPYEMQRLLREYDAERTFKLSYGALYSVVKQLSAAGFIEEHTTDRTGKLPERTVYRITPRGVDELHAWLSEIVAKPQPEYSSFVAALSLIVVLPPDDVADLLTSRLEHLRNQHESIRATRNAAVDSGVHPIFLIEDDYRLSIIQAEIDFVKNFVSTVSDPTSEWSEPWRKYHTDTTAPPSTEKKL